MTDIRRHWVLDPGRTPAERILGKEFGAGGPLGLLGLSPEQCTSDGVTTALAQQLERVNEHPHATSHEADEVRLALHAAAAQLMDPRTREAIIAGTLAVRAWSRPRRPVSPLLIARARPEIRRTLGRFGGLNERSIRFLALVADRHGIARDQLAEAVRGAMRETGRPFRPITTQTPVRGPLAPTRPGAGPTSRQAAGAAPTPAEIDPAVRVLRLVLVLGAVAVLCLALAGGAVWMIVRAISTSPQSPRAPARIASPNTPPSSAAPSPTADARPEKAAPVEVVESDDPIVSARALGSAVELLATDSAGALVQFSSAFEVLGRTWVDLEPDRVASAQDSIVEFLYQSASHGPIAQDACRVVVRASEAARQTEPPAADRIIPAVWSVGTLARLARERELPAQVRTTIDAELALAASGSVSAGAGSFASGASAALHELPRRLVRPRDGATAAVIAAPEAFDQWLRAVRAIAGTDERAVDRFTLGALESVLTDGPEPEPSTPAGAVVSRLVKALSWRTDSDSRPRLVRWFDSVTVSTTDLNAVTGTLASDSAAEGVDVSMVMPSRAGLPERQEMRDRYLAAWSLKDQRAVDELVGAWAAAARQHTAADSVPPEPVAQLARAAVLSRINLAAAHLHAGLSAEPGDLMRTLDSPVLAALGGPGSTSAPTSLGDTAGDGVWARQYIEAEKNIPQRAALLAELGQRGPSLGPIDAEVLAAEAFRGAPTQIRRAASDLMGKFSMSPAVVNAALEQAPFMPRTQEASDLARRLSLGRVPNLRDPEWRLGLRRALVERLLQMLASRGEDRSVDALAGVIGAAYSGRASVGAVDRASASPPEKLSPDAAARAVRAAWQRWAESIAPSGREPLTMDQIQRRYSGRSGLAEGLVQVFAAEQSSIVDLMAYVVAAERPDAAPEVRAVLDRLGASLRKAEHVFGQILSAESAMTELWMLRLDVGAPA